MKLNINTQRAHYDLPKTQDKNKANDGKMIDPGKSTQTNRVDTYTPSEKLEPVAYEKPTVKPDTKTIEELKNASEHRLQQLQNLVNQLLKKQGYSLTDARSGAVKIDVDEETRLKAQSAIDEGGEHSIENVSNRLLDFAIAISGGDKSKLDTLKGAVEAGFKAAEKAFGGRLPDISYKTLEATMEKLDKWATEKE